MFLKNSSVALALALAAIVVVAPPGNAQHEDHAMMGDMPGDTIYIAGHSKEGLPVAVDRKAVLRFRDYFDAVLIVVKKGIAAGQTKDAISATATLAGFENYQSAPPVLTLAGVLGTAYDELTAK